LLKWSGDESVYEEFSGVYEMGKLPEGLQCSEQVGVFLVSTALWDEIDAIRATILDTNCQQVKWHCCSACGCVVRAAATLSGCLRSGDRALHVH
jgi:hypothetical protein